MPKKSRRPSRRHSAELRKEERDLQREFARLERIASSEHAYELKLSSAYSHLKRLKEEVAAWSSSKPFDWSQEFDEAESMTVYYAELSHAPLKRFASLAGDCLHNARAALDHIVYEIAEFANGRPLPAEVAEGSEFPITGPKPLSEAACKRKIGALPEDAQRMVMSLQPSELGSRYAEHKLWLLHDLERIDKHRRPLVAAPVFTEMSVSVPATAGIRERPGGRAHYRLQFNIEATFDGRTEMARFPTEGFDEDHVPSLDIGLLVLLEDSFPAGGNSLLYVLDELFGFVLTDVVKPLRRFLQP